MHSPILSNFPAWLQWDVLCIRGGRQKSRLKEWEHFYPLLWATLEQHSWLKRTGPIFSGIYSAILIPSWASTSPGTSRLLAWGL